MVNFVTSTKFFIISISNYRLMYLVFCLKTSAQYTYTDALSESAWEELFPRLCSSTLHAWLTSPWTSCVMCVVPVMLTQLKALIILNIWSSGDLRPQLTLALTWTRYNHAEWKLLHGLTTLQCSIWTKGTVEVESSGLVSWIQIQKQESVITEWHIFS